MDIPFQHLAPLIVMMSLMGLVGWVLTTWMRVKHGYPLDGLGPDRLSQEQR